MAERVKKDETLINILKIIAPGTKFREGLDNILKAKTGALIIIGDSKEIMDIVDGRFQNRTKIGYPRTFKVNVGISR